MASYNLGSRSLRNLEGVHPDLVRVIKRAIKDTPEDFMVLEGVRTRSRQAQLYAKGRTAPGPKVTWTLTKSRHFVNKVTGYGHAVDCAPYPIDWNNIGRFDRMAGAIMKAAKAEGVRLRWGADWDMDGKARERGESDSPHFELAY